MKKNKIDKEIKRHFANRNSFTRQELFNFYHGYEEDLNYQTFGWRVFDLKKKEIIHSIGRGIYKINDKEVYEPAIDVKTKDIYTKLQEKYYDLKIIIWNTRWINEFSLHQTFNNFYLVEVRSDTTESVFFSLKDLGFQNVYLKPNEEKMYQYVLNEEGPIVVLPMISRSPSRRIEKVRVPKLEKILVDIFCDEKTFYSYQGNELKNIYRNALRTYTINFSELINYSRRRGRDKEIEEYLSLNFSEYLGEDFQW